MRYHIKRYDDDWDIVTDKKTGEQRWVDKDGNQFKPNTGLTGIITDGLGSPIDEDDKWDLDEDNDD